MKEFLRDREKQGKISNWTGVGVTVLVHLLIFVVLLLSGLTYLYPPPPAKEYFEMELPELEEEDETHPVPWGEETTAEEANDENDIELVRKSESPIQADDKPNVASAGKTTPEGDVEVATPKDALANPNVNFGALQRPKESNTSDTAEDPSANVSSGQADGNVSEGKNDGVAKASLEGRSARSIGRPPFNPKQEGRVIVDITVDRDGVVKSANITSTQIILSEAQRQQLLKAARESRFEKDSKAAELQKGTITYIFKLE